MNHLSWLHALVRPYRKPALTALLLLTVLVFMDLLIPRLIQRIIDHGIRKQDTRMVVQMTLWMLGISGASFLMALANSILSSGSGKAWPGICVSACSSRSRHFPSAISID